MFQPLALMQHLKQVRWGLLPRQCLILKQVLIGHSLGGKVVMSMAEQFGLRSTTLPRPVQVLCDIAAFASQHLCLIHLSTFEAVVLPSTPTCNLSMPIELPTPCLGVSKSRLPRSLLCSSMQLHFAPSHPLLDQLLIHLDVCAGVGARHPARHCQVWRS